jgi:hypothetical protein
MTRYFATGTDPGVGRARVGGMVMGAWRTPITGLRDEARSIRGAANAGQRTRGLERGIPTEKVRIRY